MTWFGLMNLFNAVMSLAAGTLVWGRNRNDRIAFSFFRFSSTVSAWAISYAIWQFMSEHQSALFYCRMQFFFAVFVSMTITDFAVTLTDTHPRYRKFLRAIIAVGFLTAATAFSPYFIPDVVQKLQFRYWPIMGPTGHVYFIYFWVTVFFSFNLLIHTWRRTVNVPARRRLKLVTLLLLLGFAGGSTSWLLDYDIMIPPVPNFFVGLIMLGLAYGIVRYKLFDVQTLAEMIRDTKLSAMGQVAASLTHEIKNPLYVLRNSIHLFRDKWQNAPHDSHGKEELLTQFVEQVTKQTERALSVVEQFKKLNASATDDGASQATTLPAVLSSVIQSLDYEFRYRGVQTDVSGIDCLHPPVAMPASESEAIVSNILLNAAQASKSGSTIKISSERNNGTVDLLIKDEGPGIPKENIERIFEPFYTTKPHGKGTGLGLYIARQLMEKNGGSIEAESRIGEGTTFRLKFKAAKS